MKNRPLSQPKMKATEPPIPVVEYAGAPVMTRRESDGHIADIEVFPFTQFMNSIKAEIMDQITNSSWHHDWLSGSNPAQRASIQMIEVSVGDQDQIDGGEMINSDSGPADPLYHLKPERPDRIDQNVKSSPADQE
jgi:hypothetical protein